MLPEPLERSFASDPDIVTGVRREPGITPVFCWSSPETMPRRRTELAQRARRGWVWRADAEWRWQRALRFLISICGAKEREASSGDGGGVRSSFDGPSSREADDCAALDRLQTYAHQQQWELTPEEIYQDDGYSGARLDRPVLDRLRDAAANAAVDVVLITSPDRLARR